MTNSRLVQFANSTGRGLAFMLASAACWLALCHGARAIGTCEGTYSGSSIHPVPSPNVVQYQPETNDQPTELGQRFIAGLQRGGVVMTGQPTTRLDIDSTLTPPSGQSRKYHGAGWAQDTPGSGASVVSSTLQLGLTLTDIQTGEIIWIASLTCTVRTNDQGRVVESIGEQLGRSIGKDFGTRRF